MNEETRWLIEKCYLAGWQGATYSALKHGVPRQVDMQPMLDAMMTHLEGGDLNEAIAEMRRQVDPHNESVSEEE